MQGICVPVVLAGHVTEPRVAFSHPSLHFGAVLLGRSGTARIELTNEEAAPFDFELDKSSYDATDEITRAKGRPPLVTFNPVAGTIPANGSVTLTATFRPEDESAVNYTVQCKVARKAVPLAVNVKGQGYAVRPRLVLQGGDGAGVPLAPQVCFAHYFGLLLLVLAHFACSWNPGGLGHRRLLPLQGSLRCAHIASMSEEAAESCCSDAVYMTA